MNKAKKDLSALEKVARSKAKKMDKHMRKNQSDYQSFAVGLATAHSLQKESEMKEWVESDDYAQIDSQQLVESYEQEYMTSDDEE